MRDHPLTPMRDPSLVRVLARQTRHRVGLIAQPIVARGRDAIEGEIARLRRDGVRHAIVDAVRDDDLVAIGAACAELPLVTGGSGIALGLPDNFRRAGLLAADDCAADTLPPVEGFAAVLSGSCSQATLAQVEAMRARRPVLELDPLELAASADAVGRALDWAVPRLAGGPVLVSASAPPERVRMAQETLGRERAGAVVEAALAAIARGLVERGVRRLVVAGGETSGAVVQALGVKALRIGPQIDPGVPWTLSLGTPPVALALKSGNFGGRDFFLRAFEVLG
jgi:uncharacterized protein YgbK (DUF1537 family)